MGAAGLGAAQASGEPVGLAEEDVLRADAYALLGWLLKSPPKRDDLRRGGALQGDKSEFGQAMSARAAAARATTPEAVEEEDVNLFIGVGRGEVVPDTAVYSLDKVAAAEAALGRPVVTANQATVWQSLRLLGREHRLADAGTLFAARLPATLEPTAGGPAPS